MESKIKPAIISQNFNETAYKIDLVDDLVSWVHLDVMDGKFAPTISPHEPQDLELLEGKAKLEVHLMVEYPEESLLVWTQVADRVVVHLEATENLSAILDSLEPHSTQLGVAVLLETPLEKLEPYLPRLDFVQLMSIKKIGSQGEPFDPDVLERIKNLRQMWPGGIIQVDGGINLETSKDCLKAGADILVVGSAIWSTADPVTSLRELSKL